MLSIKKIFKHISRSLYNKCLLTKVVIFVILLIILDQHCMLVYPSYGINFLQCYPLLDTSCCLNLKLCSSLHYADFDVCKRFYANIINLTSLHAIFGSKHSDAKYMYSWVGFFHKCHVQ